MTSGFLLSTIWQVSSPVTMNDVYRYIIRSNRALIQAVCEDFYEQGTDRGEPCSERNGGEDKTIEKASFLQRHRSRDLSAGRSFA